MVLDIPSGTLSTAAVFMVVMGVVRTYDKKRTDKNGGLMSKMKKRVLCKLGFHIWYDAMNLQNEDGSFQIRKCMKCNDFKVYREYTIADCPRLHLLERKEIPKSIKIGRASCRERV